MKQFNLKEYLENPSRKVVTRDGRNVKILCTNFTKAQHIIAQIEGNDYSTAFHKDGIFVNGVEEFRKVPVKTLDSFNLKDIGFIKIDVEGFEEKVIRGGLLTIISNNYPPILFECWRAGQIAQDGTVFTQEKRDSLFNLLRTLGYEILEGWGNIDTHLAVHK